LSISIATFEKLGEFWQKMANSAGEKTVGFPQVTAYNLQTKGNPNVNRTAFAPKTIILAFTLLLAACAPAAEAIAPKAPLPDDVARRVARLDALSQIKDGSDPSTLRSVQIARLDRLAQIKDMGAPLDERDARIARLDELAQIKG
jgi:hypothetical protein